MGLRRAAVAVQLLISLLARGSPKLIEGYPVERRHELNSYTKMTETHHVQESQSIWFRKLLISYIAENIIIDRQD